MDFDLQSFNKLLGQDSYVRCINKRRMDAAIVNQDEATLHLSSGGQIGWWVRQGYIVVDIDEGKEQVLAIVKKLKIRTLMAKTPRGLHLFFKTNQNYPQQVGMIFPCGLKGDFRCANKGYIILPYGQKDRSFNKTHEIAELPIEFSPLLERKDSLLGLRDGEGRNSSLFAHLMVYKNHGANDDRIEKMATAINDIVFDEPLREAELRTIINNVGKYNASSEEWPQIVPFTTIELSTFPIESLPNTVASFVAALSESTQTHPEMGAIISLGILATAFQRRLTVEITPDWSEPLSLFTVAVAAPGERKSAVIGALTEPVYDYEHTIQESERTEIAQNRTQRAMLEKRLATQRDESEALALSAELDSSWVPPSAMGVL